MANQHSQTSGSSATTLLDATVEAFDQGKAATPQEGLSLITDWFSSLKNNHQARPIVEPLKDLQAELQSGTPSNQRLHDLFLQLAEQTEQLANEAQGDLPSRLTTLAQAFRNFAGQLSTTV